MHAPSLDQVRIWIMCEMRPERCCVMVSIASTWIKQDWHCSFKILLTSYGKVLTSSICRHVPCWALRRIGSWQRKVRSNAWFFPTSWVYHFLWLSSEARATEASMTLCCRSRMYLVHHGITTNLECKLACRNLADPDDKHFGVHTEMM